MGNKNTFISWADLIPESYRVFTSGYSRSMLSKDILAGLAVGVIALPLAVAFAKMGTHLVLSGVGEQPRKALDAIGFSDRIGKENICETMDDALVRVAEVLAEMDREGRPQAHAHSHAHVRVHGHGHEQNGK